MGMWTELYLAIELKEDTPAKVVNTIQKLLSPSSGFKGGSESYSWPDHDFFKTDRFWKCLDDDCYYFPSRTMHCFEHDDISDSWYLTLITKVKNYGNEFQKFIDWLQPYIDNEGHIGHYRYENQEMPTMLFVKDGRVNWLPVKAEALS